MAFPRFNFISDSELLEILSNPKDINIAQVRGGVCFLVPMGTLVRYKYIPQLWTVQYVAIYCMCMYVCIACVYCMEIMLASACKM